MARRDFTNSQLLKKISFWRRGVNAKLVVAVSGGVDSVVLLDMLAATHRNELIVAHFDHGIRSDSADDAEFVGSLAKKYDIQFETVREELGAGASEELARKRRYHFLRNLAQKHQASIVTAHHRNDVTETVAINLLRGTGWRGLAALDSDIQRPLLDLTKAEILEYARQNDLSWREDSSNQSLRYLRNRLRPKIIDESLMQRIAELRASQLELKSQITAELESLELQSPYQRYFFIMLNQTTAQEVLNFITKGRLTRPQIESMRLAIATAAPGTTFQAGGRVKLVFSARIFVVQLI